MSSSKVSFGFGRKTETKIIKPAATLAPEDKLDVSLSSVEFISSVQDLEFSPRDPSSSRITVIQGDLVIPLIKRNRYATSATAFTPSTLAAGPNLSQEDAAAAAAILKDISRPENPADSLNSDLEIPLWMQNRLPAGFETDTKLDVGLRAEVSSLDDYDRVPVEAYGLAMLRGMGWKAEQGIGLTNKQVTKPLEVLVRPRGLGLGATPKPKAKAKEGQNGVENGKAQSEQQEPIGVDSCVKVCSGRYEGRTGKVRSVDGDSDQFIIELVGQEKRTVRIAGACLDCISQKEYHRAGRYINDDDYFDYKIVDDVAKMKVQSEQKVSVKREERDGESTRKKESRRRSRSRSRESRRH